jgi:hypothetical protein
MLIYLDSTILIYYLDGLGPFQARAVNRLTTLRAADDQIAASDLTRPECRVKPIQLGDTLRLSKFDGFFGLPDVRMVPLTTAVYFVEIRLYKNLPFAMGCLIGFLNTMEFRGTNFLLPIMLQRIYHYTPFQAGLFFLPPALVMGIT